MGLGNLSIKKNCGWEARGKFEGSSEGLVDEKKHVQKKKHSLRFSDYLNNPGVDIISGATGRSMFVLEVNLWKMGKPQISMYILLMDIIDDYS